jgi:hypothetical protein
VADQKPLSNLRVLLFFEGSIKVGCYREPSLGPTEEINKFIEQYAKKIVDQGDESYPIGLKVDKEDQSFWDIDGVRGTWYSKPTFWMELPYKPIDIKDLA